MRKDIWRARLSHHRDDTGRGSLKLLWYHSPESRVPLRTLLKCSGAQGLEQITLNNNSVVGLLELGELLLKVLNLQTQCNNIWVFLSLLCLLVQRHLDIRCSHSVGHLLCSVSVLLLLDMSCRFFCVVLLVLPLESQVLFLHCSITEPLYTACSGSPGTELVPELVALLLPCCQSNTVTF